MEAYKKFIIGGLITAYLLETYNVEFEWKITKRKPKSVVSYKDVPVVEKYIFATRSSARDALNKLLETLDLYKVVTVADYYDTVGKATVYQDVNIGWTDLSEARVVAEGYRGFCISLPAPKKLK